MADLNGFDANEVEPAVGFTVLPAAEYLAMIKASEMKDTKAGTGKMLVLTLEIVEGEYQGNVLFARLNLENPNELAVKIAKAELSAICRAVGVMTPRDSVELHNVPMVINVKCVDRKDKPGTMSNEISSYKPRGGAAPTASAPAAAKSDDAPWKKK